MNNPTLPPHEGAPEADPRRHLVVTPRIRIPHDEFEFQFARSGGPGGQNVNKVNSKATLRFRVLDSPSLTDDVKRRFTQRFASKLLNDGSVQRTGKSAFRAAEVGVSAMLSVDAHALRLDVQIDVPDMPRRR